jgi:hypothetical protein
MLKNNKEILNLIDTFQIKRAREIDETILNYITAHKEREGIRNLFISEEYLQEDKNGYLASFVVLSPNNTPLIFFSLRCGELFEKISDKDYIVYEFYHNFISEVNKGNKDKAREILKNFTLKNPELSFEDFLEIGKRIGEKLKTKKNDLKKFKDKESTNHVSNSYPAVELKLFGINESAKDYWNKLNLATEIKMGETLFWLKVVKTIEEMTKYVGCQYVYLFAADKEVEGKLVQYYKTRLGFESSTDLSANKPSFDTLCQFLFTKTDDLFKTRDEFRQQIQKNKRKRRKLKSLLFLFNKLFR